MAHDGDALLGKSGIHQVDLLKVGDQKIEPSELSCRSANARVVLIRSGFRRRKGIHHLPDLGDASGRVLGQQGVQECRPGSGQSGDEDGAPDRLLPNFRVAFARFHQLKAAAKQAQDVAVRANAPEKIQPGVRSERLQKDGEALEYQVVTKIVETGLPAGHIDECVRIERQ